jgi:hypothetical protein
MPSTVVSNDVGAGLGACSSMDDVDDGFVEVEVDALVLERFFWILETMVLTGACL